MTLIIVLLIAGAARFVYGLGALRIMLPFYTKLRRDRLLRIPARDALFRIIQDSPGIHFVELQKQVGTLHGGPRRIAFGVLAYHLGMMERFNLIVSKREGRYRRYFDADAGMGADASRVALLRTTPIPLIAAEILAQPGVTQREIHHRIAPRHPVTRQALSYHLKRLLARDLIEVTEAGRYCHYRPTERLVRLASFVGGFEPVDPSKETPVGPTPAAA